MWFLLALITMLAWGLADLFYKISSDENDRYSYLKIAVWVGMVMGTVSIVLIPFTEGGFDILQILKNGAKYAPASLAYIISMVIGYAGMRYLEISIVSPVQNASGAFSAIAMIVFFSVKGSFRSISEQLSPLDIIGTILIIMGVVALAFVEKNTNSGEKENKERDKKYKKGALALIFPVLYCIFDTIGTAADGIILDEEYGLGLGETDVLVLYGLTFFLAGICCWIFMLVKTKKPYNPFTLSEIKSKAPAAVFEEAGQVFYIYAMSSKPMIAAPMVAAYCIVSVILSRIFIKEKLSPAQYMCVIGVIAGIVLLGISEGLSE